MPIAALLAKVPMWAWILVAALLVIGVQQWRVHHYRAQAASLQGVANTLHDANLANQATIVALQATADDWARKCSANQPEARQQAQASAQGDAKRRAQAADSIKNLRYQVQHDAIVKSWADVPVPVVAFDSLRKNGSTD